MTMLTVGHSFACSTFSSSTVEERMSTNLLTQTLKSLAHDQCIYTNDH